MTKLLDGQVAIVTGASRGMGRHFAKSLAEAGARVALVARASDKLEAVAAEIPGSLAIACDVSDPDSVRAAFATFGQAFGRLDILVNNAGVSLLNRVESVSDADVQREIAINLAGPIYMSRSAIPLLRASGRGDIVNVSSESAKMPWPFLTIYAATKAGLEAFTAGLREEVREDLIRVTALRAGYVAGGELDRNWSDVAKGDFWKTITASGHAGLAGSVGIPPEAMGHALVNLLTLPREVDVDLITLRPTGR